MRGKDLIMQEIELKPAKQNSEVHIALDMDSTLSYYEGWDKQGHKLGKPIKKMVENVKSWLKKGYLVTIFTARLSHGAVESERQIALIQKFLRENDLPDTLPISCVKAHWFTIFIDDKAYHVIPNTGVIEGNTGL